MSNLLVSKFHICLIEELQVLMVIVIKWCFFDKLLDLEDLFDYENICDGKKVKLYKLREYALHWWEWIQTDRIRQDKDKIHSWPRMKKLLAIKYYSLDCDELLLYTKQDYY